MTSSNRWWSFAFVLAVALGGCGPNENVGIDDSAAGQSRIVGGSGFSGLPAVGALTYNGNAHCTATLVGPRTVLTAGHCLSGFQASRFRFVIGSSLNSAEYSLRISSTHVHPYYDANSITNDIAYATLQSDAPIAPLGVLDGMDSSWRGEDLFFVGYGVDNGYNQTGAGTKRAVWMSISQVNSTSFRYDDPNKNTCNGDSGGPAFYQTPSGEYLVAGVTSYGDYTCSQYGVDTRVDTYLDFLGVTGTPADGGTTDPAPDPTPTPDPTPDPAPSGCGNETYEGHCSGDTVTWCENDQIYTQDCATQDKTCGWSDANQYYGCVAPPDPCNGETYEGRCDGKTVVWCENQQVQSIDCQRRCGYDNNGGYYNCL